jgi:hypothetical protein
MITRYLLNKFRLRKPTRKNKITPETSKPVFIHNFKIEDITPGSTIIARDNTGYTRVTILEVHETEIIAELISGPYAMKLAFDKPKLLDLINIGYYEFYPKLKVI